MAFGKKFQANELLALVEVLDGQGQAGMPLPGLANRVGLSLGSYAALRQLSSTFLPFWLNRLQPKHLERRDLFPSMPGVPL